MQKGLKESLKWGDDKFIEEWLAQGSEYEDAGGWWAIATGNGRFMNHFHNPLKPWEDAGLNAGLFKGQSSLVWAQDGYNQRHPRWPDPPEGGDYSWSMVRAFFILALISETDADRQAYLAQTFRGLGHQLHLLEDKAVPSHVRNDAHPLSPAIEEWLPVNQYLLPCLFEDHETLHPNVLQSCSILNTSQIDIQNFYPTIDTTVFERTVTGADGWPVKLSPSALYTDTDTYLGGTPTTNLTQGLAEYTNSNFFSDDTIFTENREFDDPKYFPYPRRESTNIAQVEASQGLPKLFTARDQVQDSLLYVEKISEGERVEHFARIGFLWEHLGMYTPLALRHLILDDECHKDYAKLLIPRAVGYSAGLIDYFFRGDMHMTQADATTGITVRNDSTETMTFYSDERTQRDVGSISIYYDDTSEARHLLGSVDLDAPLDPGEEIFVECNNPDHIYPPTDNIQEGRYIMVFHGKLGNEEGAVVGKIGIYLQPTPVYYVAEFDGVEKIMRRNSDGSDPTIVYDNQFPAYYDVEYGEDASGVRFGKLDLSPDGKTLAITANGPGYRDFPLNPGVIVDEDIGSRIFLLDLESGSIEFLTYGYGADWSPDGTKLVYTHVHLETVHEANDVIASNATGAWICGRSGCWDDYYAYHASSTPSLIWTCPHGGYTHDGAETVEYWDIFLDIHGDNISPGKYSYSQPYYPGGGYGDPWYTHTFKELLEIYVMDMETRDESRLTYPDPDCRGNMPSPSWAVIDLVGGWHGPDWQRVWGLDSYNAYPAWSPDGSLIAFSSTCRPVEGYDPGCDFLEAGDRAIIYVMEPDGSNIRPVTCQDSIDGTGGPESMYSDTWATWSPDGNEIAFLRSGGCDPGIIRCPAQTSADDPDSVCFDAGEDYVGCKQLYKVDVETFEITLLTESHGRYAFNENESAPSWSDDGSFIAISTANGESDADIWLVDPNGGGYLENMTVDREGGDMFPSVGW